MRPPPHLPTGRPQKTSGAATASLILGIFSCGLSCLTGIPAIIFGVIGLNRISSSDRASAGPRLTGQGLAIAGIILGGINMLVAPVLVGLMLPAVQAAREAARRTECLFNVRGFAQGMLVAESVHRVIPAAIVDGDGRPLLSWRVAILPYTEEGALYNEFHLDEPWDSEHNLKLLPRMPSMYVCPSSGLDPGVGKTTYLAAAGPGMALSSPAAKAGGPGGVLLSGVPGNAISDGWSKTVLILEVPPEDAVPWTKPQDFDVAPAEAAARLFTNASHQGGIHMVVFGDTHVAMLTPDVDTTVLAAILTRAGGESVTLDD